MFWQEIQKGFAAMSPLEILGTITGLASVWLTVRRNIWCWPIGLISVVAYAILFYQVKLYADAGLQVFFFVTSIQGWYWWLKGSNSGGELPVTRLTAQQQLILALVTIVCVAIVGWAFMSYTDAHLPFWDAAAAGVSVTAQAIMLRKKIECWPLWLGVDVLYVGIYIYKKLYLTAGLYAIFLVLAAIGWQEWIQAEKAQSSDDRVPAR